MHKLPPADNAQHTTAQSAQSVTTGNASLTPQQGLPPVDEFAQQMLMQQQGCTPYDIEQRLQQCTNASSNYLRVAKFDDFVTEGLTMKEPRELYNSVIVEGETTILFGDTGTGKTTFALQMASKISEFRRVLYVNFELSQQQVAKRYKRKYPTANLYIATADYSLMNNVNDQNKLLSFIEERALAIGADVIFIDNLTNLCVNSKEGAEAGQLMLRLLKVRLTHGWTLVVLAHVPKRKENDKLTLNDVAGSKLISNITDNVIGFNRSKKGKDTRYIIQLKWRSGQITLDEHNVQELIMTDSDGWLHFEYGARGEEYKHLPRTRDEKMELEMEILKELRKVPEISYRAIANELGTSTTKVANIAKAHGIRRADKKE